jgi:hypothetical protein
MDSKTGKTIFGTLLIFGVSGNIQSRGRCPYEIKSRITMAKGSTVGIVTDYGLDGPGIEEKILVGPRFLAHAQTGLGIHPASCTMGTGSFPEVKRMGRDAEHSPPSSAEVTKG